MVELMFVDEHNELAMLLKPKQAEGFHQIVDFLRSSHIAHTLIVNPIICVEHQRQVWANAAIYTEDGNQVIKTRVCDKPLTITEGAIRIHLRLDDVSEQILTTVEILCSYPSALYFKENNWLE
ncbi:hypothetical protein L6452_05924 [Arctium lappa]|uniref:Uncharacterized protein n=1 Tax=Arctium lappa TaxID=4217 RepID=A0ACB9EH99_ARCLA|nr:hypothetical protein L6452_05924 [Arctium lappa]